MGASRDFQPRPYEKTWLSISDQVALLKSRGLTIPDHATAEQFLEHVSYYRSHPGPLATRYGVQPNILTTWLHHLVYIRNVCAHHSRFWDRRWTIKPKLPAGKSWDLKALNPPNRLVTTLLIVSWLLSRIPQARHLRVEWQKQVQDKLNNPPRVSSPEGAMGTFEGWTEHVAWAG